MKKNFSLCPLCEFNDVIYDYKGGNVLRGTWRKPTEDKIIKQDLGNTLRRNPDVSEQETGQPLKDYLRRPTAEENTSEMVRNEAAAFVFRSLHRKMLLFTVLLQQAVNYLQSKTCCSVWFNTRDSGLFWNIIINVERIWQVTVFPGTFCTNSWLLAIGIRRVVFQNDS